jgi:carbamoyl-phosphate synthase large subunit
MNILICSAGRRVKLIEYFKEELHKVDGKVVAVDCDIAAPALYHADHFEIAPRINQPGYIQYIKELCMKYKINAVMSLIDPELALLAEFREEFEKEGIQVIVSNKDVVDICFDKYLTYQFLRSHEIPAIPTYSSIYEAMLDLGEENIDFPLIVKPRKGSASIGIHKIHSEKELMAFKSVNKEIIIQPFIAGEEFGVDCYIDLITKETTNIFLKRKIKMRAGETDKSISVSDSALKELIEKLIIALKPIGPIDIDCFKTKNGYVVSEINPRFGGGYLHAHEMGENFVRNIINNLNGESNERSEKNYEEGTTMVKYDQLILLPPLPSVIKEEKRVGIL